ncbi:hypothetical protein [Phaeocystidibacter luteus]|uniref:hypothetical protein n=1 Tax=Phaeocystidibacter luteus TaxID=911197 RepID=UPI0014786CE9|nr:hypothetical protein [Phaeocystidibacter luteus]
MRNFLHVFHGDERMPTLKSIANEMGISASAFHKRIHKIHNLLMSEDYANVPIQVKQGKVQFALTGFKGFKLVTVEGLHRIPRRSEQVDFPHFRSHTGSSMYYVNSVSHEMEEGEMVTTVYLDYGMWSPYWELRKSRAIELHEVPRNIRLGGDYEMKEFLFGRLHDRW